MNGMVKPMRRGGWSGRGLIATVRQGQRFETQIGPRQFDRKQDAIDWLQQVAAERALKLGRIVLGPDTRDYDA